MSPRTAIAAAAGLLLATALAARAVPPAAPAPAGTITFLDGEATRLVTGGKPQPLAGGARVYQGDLLETASRTRLELTLVDQSVLRLGPRSRVELDAAAFGKDPLDRKVSAKLRVGNVWAHVTRSVGGEARFEVKTDNAVAGVRGTTFRVDAATDKSCVVKVYSGTVAVAAGPLPRPAHGEGGAGGTAPRIQVPGPSEVSRAQWERIVTGMMQVKVAADGSAGAAEEFAMDEADGWETWNRARDATRK